MNIYVIKHYSQTDKDNACAHVYNTNSRRNNSEEIIAIRPSLNAEKSKITRKCINVCQPERVSGQRMTCGDGMNKGPVWEGKRRWLKGS